ncbi:MAG: hypothetical protein QGH45_00815 [Myxococcota bacterium]|nr:hypothetical protein [Myxococcota bacterium]
MKNSASHPGRSHPTATLAASVGLGTITLDTVLVPADRPLRIGGGADCDLPFTCEPADLAERRDGAWIIRLPDGVDRDSPVDGSREIRLCDWDGGITLSGGDGAAWLRLWPTRSERFRGRDRLAGPRWLVTRALPAIWIALSLTLALGSFALWASTAVRGDLNVLALGDGALGAGGELERVASLGDGMQAGGATGPWASLPTPPVPPPDAAAEAEADADADADADAAEETAPTPPEATELPKEPATDETPVAAAVPDIEVAEALPPVDTAVPTDATAGDGAADGDPSAPDETTGTAGVKAGGAGGFGLGGGTDDGFADRTESVKALERNLMACLEGEDTHRIQLVVGLDGKVENRSIDYSHGQWDRTERSCVNQALEEWAFPAGEESYEVSLRMRKGSRCHRA